MKRLPVFGLMMLLGIALLVAACGQAPPTAPAAVQTVEVVRDVVQTVEVVREVERVVTATPIEQKIVEMAGFYPSDSPYGREMLLLGYELEQQNPACRFVYSEYPGPQAYQAVNLRAQEGDPVDIYSGGGSSLAADGGEEWKAGLLVDLTEAMDTPAHGASSGRWFDTFNAAAQAQMVYDGSVVSIPYQQTQIVLWYNTDHYEQFGLTPPRTWDELMANSEVLKQNGIAAIGGGGFNGYLGYWYDMLLFRLMGNEAQAALYNGTDPSLAWTDELPVRAAELLMEPIEKGYTVDGFVGGDFTANQVAYFTGQATHIFIGTWLMGEMKDSIPAEFNQAVLFFPTITGYEDRTPYAATFGFLNSFGLYKPGTNAREAHSTECAIEYLKLFTRAEKQAAIVKNLDYVSTIRGVPGPENIPGIGELLSDTELWFPATQNLGATSPELRNKLWENLELLASQQLTPQEFGEVMQADWDEFFSR
jgi:raffinose/stachyose/melibiose transport system substrate-binding protein